MCKKQTSVSHSSTESEIISLDAGLRMDVSLALDLWDVVKDGNILVRPHTPAHQALGKIKCWETEHAVKSGAQIPKLSWKEAVTKTLMNCQTWITLSQTQVLINPKLRCIFSKIMKLWSRLIIKGRSPTMRHVSGPTELRLIGYLTESTWTPRPKSNMWTPYVISRVMSGTIFFVCWISCFSRCFLAAIFLSSEHRKNDRRRACGGKTKASKLGLKKPERETLTLVGFGCVIQIGESRIWSEFCFYNRCGDRVQNPTGSSQEWQRDDYPFSSAGKPVREKGQRSSAEKPVHGTQNQLTRMKLSHHNLEVSDNMYIEKVVTNVRQMLNRSEDDQMFYQRVNVLIWDYLCQQRWKQRYILDKITMRIWLLTRTPTSMRSRRCSTSCRSWSWSRIFTPWMRSTLLHDKVIKWAKAKVHVYSDPVLCLGKMQEHAEAKEKWQDQLQYFQQSPNQLSSSGIFSPGHTTFGNSQRNPGNNGSLSNKSRRIWRSNHLHVHVQRHRLDWERKLQWMCFSNSVTVKNYAKRLPLGPWSFHGPGTRKIVWNAQIQAWRKVENYRRCHGRQFQRHWISSIPSCQCVELGMVDSLQRGNLRTQTFYVAQFSQQISSVSMEQ